MKFKDLAELRYMVYNMWPHVNSDEGQNQLLELERKINMMLLDLESEDNGTVDLWSL